jgi:ATP-dependent DNA ligase
MIEAAGARLLYLPPYSPDFNPIEQAFAKLKALLRKAAARTLDALEAAIAAALDAFAQDECANYFTAAGYEPEWSEPALEAARALLPRGRARTRGDRWRRLRADGELVIVDGSFETLQLRLHPAESRIRKLARETPAELIVFDLLARSGISLLERPLAERRRELEDVMAQAASSVLRLGEATDQEPVARDWLGREGLDGIVAKRLDLPYQPGERAMRKFKLWKTVDCVVGGLYRKRGTQAAEHLLLGLHDEEGLLNYVGRARIYEDAAEIGRLLEPLVGGSGFTGRAPGGKSRWSGKERVPVPLAPVLVVEVSADHITGEHMRHGARLLRWRTDKPPESCTMDQIR